MKSSFYFLLVLLLVYFFQDYDIHWTLFFVYYFIIVAIMNRMLARDIEYNSNVKSLLCLEQVLTNNVKEYLYECRKEFWRLVIQFLFITSILCLALSALKIDLLFCLVLFVYCAYLLIPIIKYMIFFVQSHKNGGKIDFCVNFETDEQKEIYDDFCTKRKTLNIYEILPPTPLIHKIVIGISLLIAVFCLFIGVITLLNTIVSIFLDNVSPNIQLFIFYMLLEFVLIYFGINDIIECRKDIKLIKKCGKARSLLNENND